MSVGKIPMKEKKKAKRDAIIDAALEVFSRKGFQHTKIIEISKQANVADGTIYLYFKNKDALFIAAYESFMIKQLAYIKEVIGAIPNEYARLQKFLDLQAELFTQNPNIARFMFIELRQSPQFYEKYPSFWPLTEYTNYAGKLCKDAINADYIRKIDTDILVTIMLGTMDFALIEWLLGNKEKSLYKIKDTIIDILHNGLKKD